MLAYSDALAAAHQHLWSRRPPPEWVWRLPVGERVAGGWYFGCSLEPLRLIDDGLGPRFGGRLGFVVLDAGGIWPAYRHEVADAGPDAAPEQKGDA